MEKSIDGLRGAQRYSGQRNLWARVKPTFQARQQAVVRAAMEPQKPTGCWDFGLVFPRELLEPAEQGVDDDNIGVEAVDTGRKYEIEAKPLDRAIPGAPQRIQKKPAEKLKEMRAGNRRNPVPEDDTRGFRTRRLDPDERQVFHTLGVQMDFAMVVAGETLELFGEGTLRAMPAVN